MSTAVLDWRTAEVHQEQDVLTHPFQKRTPLADWLQTNGLKVIYEPSVSAYQRKHRQEHITSAVKAQAKRLHPGTFWSWTCPRGQTVFTLVLLGGLLMAQLFLVAIAIGIVALAMFLKRADLYPAEKMIFRFKIQAYRSQLFRYARWKSVPFFQFKRDCADLVPPQRIPSEIEALVERAQTELPALTAEVVHFDKDPFLRFAYHLTDEQYYVAVWDEQGFTIGGK